MRSGEAVPGAGFLWRERLPARPRPDHPGGHLASPAGGRVPRRSEAVWGLDWAVTSRYGGASAPPFDQLNLGGSVGDLPEAVTANRAAVAAAFGLSPDRLLIPRQCHGAEVEVVDQPWTGRGPEVDALVTGSSELALAVLVADCVPVLVADRTRGVVAVAHCGRRGLMEGVLPATLHRMQEAGADLGGSQAVVGPSVCGRCYEVPAELAHQLAAAIPITATVSWTGTPALDLAAGAVAQLTAAGVAVRWLPGCTRESPHLYSYRRDRETGRFAGVVRLRAG